VATAGFIETQRVRTKLPTELPDALTAQKEGHPAGAAYQLANGDVYRLVHAGWRKDTRREKGKPTPSK